MKKVYARDEKGLRSWAQTSGVGSRLLIPEVVWWKMAICNVLFWSSLAAYRLAVVWKTNPKGLLKGMMRYTGLKRCRFNPALPKD